MSRMHALALVVILALALFLRVVNIEQRTIWYDEAYSILFAQAGSNIEGGAADVHPLFYYELLHAWMRVFGSSPAAARLLSAVLGVMTVAVVYALGRDWFDRRTGLLAALITAIAPFHVQYSQEARMYALLTLTLISATWLYWRAWTHGRLRDWAGFALLAAISMYTQQLAAFYLIALGLLPGLLRAPKQIWRTGAAAGAALALYLPWLAHLPDQLGKLERYWVARPHILQIWLALRSFFTVNLDFEAAWWLPSFLLAALLPALLGFRAWHVLRHRTGAWNDRLALIWALWLGFAPMVFLWLASLLFQPMFLPRALLPSAVVIYLALAWLFAQGSMPRVITVLVGTAWMVLILFGLATHYRWDTFPNPPFDRAAAFLRQHAAPGDAVLHGNKITALPLRLYAPGLPQAYVQDIPGSGSDTLAVPTQRAIGWLASRCPSAAAGGAARVWYVAFEQFDAEMAEAGQDDPEARRYDSGAWLRAHFIEGETYRFNDLVVTLFTDPDAVARSGVCGDESAGR